MFTVYVLYSRAHDKIYIGYTSNLRERLLSHNELATKGYTIKFRPWEVSYTEVFTTKSEAMKREKQLKTARGRAFIWETINKSYGTGFIFASWRTAFDSAPRYLFKSHLKRWLFLFTIMFVAGFL